MEHASGRWKTGSLPASAVASRAPLALYYYRRGSDAPRMTQLDMLRSKSPEADAVRAKLVQAASAATSEQLVLLE